MLKVSKMEKVKYPKDCTWCGQLVTTGPFTYGRVSADDKYAVLLHGEIDKEGSCAYKFVKGQVPIDAVQFERPSEPVETRIAITPAPDIEDYVFILRDDIMKLDARLKTMQDTIDCVLDYIKNE